MTKRLYRSKTDKKISGVCGGMADYFAIDPVIVRLLWVLGTLMSLFLGVAAYIACAFIIPEEPDTIDADFKTKQGVLENGTEKAYFQRYAALRCDYTGQLSGGTEKLDKAAG